MPTDKYGYTQEQMQQVKRITDKIRTEGLEVSDVLQVMEQWESRITLAAKKAYITFSTILAVAAFMRVDYREIQFWGLSDPNGSWRLMVVFFLAMAIPAVVFLINRHVDLHRKNGEKLNFEVRFRR